MGFKEGFTWKVAIRSLRNTRPIDHAQSNFRMVQTGNSNKFDNATSVYLKT